MGFHAECGKGWSARCANSKGKKCRCRCGGSNHGKLAGRDSVQRDFHARWEVVSIDAEVYTIRDVGHVIGRSVTNDAEWVVEQIVPELGGRRLFYYDSMGDLDELLVRDGRFVGFAPVHHFSLAYANA